MRTTKRDGALGQRVTKLGADLYFDRPNQIYFGKQLDESPLVKVAGVIYDRQKTHIQAPNVIRVLRHKLHGKLNLSVTTCDSQEKLGVSNCLTASLVPSNILNIINY